MSFVIKNSKKYNLDERTTLDVNHLNMLNKLEKTENDIPKLQNKINALKRKLEKLEKDIIKHEKNFNHLNMLNKTPEITNDNGNIDVIDNGNVDVIDNVIEEDFLTIKLNKYQTKRELTEELQILETKLNKITSDKYDYLLGSMKYVRQYHNIDIVGNTRQVKKKKVKLENFFKCDSDDSGNESEITNNKAVILNNYLRDFDPNYQDHKLIYNSSDKEYMWCVECNIEKSIIQNEGILVCTQCGITEKALIDSTKPSYNDSSQQDVNNFTYKKINHFTECINQSQGKETTTIPKDIYILLLREIKKDDIKYYDLTDEKIREYLRLYKLNKYYEHIPYIKNKLTGIDSPAFNNELQDKLKNMFKEIQTPYKMYKPDNRKNFLSYNYIFYKFLELLNEPEHAKRYSLLKSDEKLQTMDDIWEKICKDLGWTFIPSNK